MDQRSEVRNFLVSRRERLTPEQAGVQFHGGKRRVKGLRREEVAMLAAVSTDYYTRLERGDLTGVSEAVLESLARALKLDESERAHLFNLARAAAGERRSAPTTSRPRRPGGLVREGVQRMLDSIQAPAYVRNQRMDLLAFNRMGRALFADALTDPSVGFNLARYLFLDPRAREFYVHWDAIARDSVAALRIAAGSNPYDQGLTDLVGQLSMQSDEFRTWLATYNVKLHRSATKVMHHSVVGDLELTGEALDLPADRGLTLILYTVEPASPSAQALAFLSSWSSEHAPEATPSHSRVPGTTTGEHHHLTPPGDP